MARFLAFLAVALWLGTAAFLGWRFVVGDTHTAADGRTAITLSAADRDFVLGEMRGLLGAVQSVVAAIADKDAPAVAAAARRAGNAATHGAPPGLMTSLPLEFKQMGMAVHDDFDALAAAAQGGESPDALLSMLGSTMQSCVACHQLYRLEAAQ